MISKEEIEDEIKSLTRKRDEHLAKANEIQEQVINKVEILYSLDKDMIRINCINCNSLGYTKEGEKKTLCRLCNGKRYNWMKVFKEEKDGN